MRLLRLELRNYRNYARLDFEPAPGLNLLLGANGQGKTNLLEAIALLALASSPRTQRISELVGPLAGEARLRGEVERKGRKAEILVSVQVAAEGGRRRISVDGQPRRALDLPGVCRVTLFWPEDLELIKGGPEQRRRLLNQVLVQTRPGYAHALSRYARVLEQRNSLLRQVAEGEQPASALDVWDFELARLGGELVEARRLAVEALAPLAARNHAPLSGGEALELEYLGPPVDLLEALGKARREDLRRGVSTVGPHRDDLLILLEGKEARAYASQGQQRTAVVSLKLAEAEVVAGLTGEQPILLLDDVLSELDPVRRRALLGRLEGPGQVIVTSVEGSLFGTSLLRQALVRCIERGELRACA